MRIKIIRVVKILNLPRHICHQALGEQHSLKHRLSAGTGIMVIGVGIAKAASDVHFPGSHFILDLIGYAIHGIGATPFIEWLIKGDSDSSSQQSKEQ